MGEREIDMLFVCGTVQYEDNEKSTCSECGATIYATKGSLAKMSKAKVVCVNCWPKFQNAIHGGWLHRGRFIEPTPQNTGLADYVRNWYREKMGL